MQNTRLKVGFAALLAATMLAMTSLAQDPGVESSVIVTEEGVPGGIRVDTYELTATVDAVNAASRELTLVAADGSTTVLVAGPDVVNFDQIQVGDEVKAMTAEQLVVFMRKSGEPSNDGEEGVVALAAVGEKPGAFVANTVEATATVEALDLSHRKATLRFPSGVTRSYAVREDVDMTQAKLGDEIVIQSTQVVAISVEKPMAENMPDATE